ncbi:MAG: lactate utilization protein [Deltaproteobacteria bacterium]|nr:lactate utilization protein [Deltaproteobacteria bacterium]
MRQDIRDRSRDLLRDDKLQDNLRRALGHTLDRRAALVAENPGWAELRDRARDLRDESLRRLPELRAQVERQVRGRGGGFHFCRDAAEARARVIEILDRAGAVEVVKGKSMVSEEIALNAALEARGIAVFEGDLGELIVQLRGERPAHITAPALHLDRRQIAALFRRALGQDVDDDPVRLAAAARRFLRPHFLGADAGITGANFVVAESGSVVLVENESNIRLATTLPRLHIAITGIEKLVPRLADLAPLLALLPVSATGQKASAAVSILGGPRPSGEDDGPREFHLVLVDNGRQALISDPILRPALRCIRCGACLNVCPVFQRIGGHGYGAIYPGPIGVVLARALLGRSDGAHAFACSLCGACDEICPVQVPLSRLILEVRRRAQQDAGVTAERMAHAAFAEMAQWPRLFKMALAASRAAIRWWPRWFSTSLTGGWTDLRAWPRPRRDGELRRRTGSGAT